MRRLLLSAGLCAAAACLSASAQAPAANKSQPGSIPQIPFGQTYKDFQFPLYQNGTLNATLSAVSAKGITINRAETTDLKIDLYTDNKVTTTITSPKADLYVADRIMRTKNTVLVERADLEARSQACDFDLGNKKYLMRQNVHVLLKNFDVGAVAKGSATTPAGAKHASGASTPEVGAPIAPAPVSVPLPAGSSVPDIPGASAGTNASPPSPATP